MRAPIQTTWKKPRQKKDQVGGACRNKDHVGTAALGCSVERRLDGVLTFACPGRMLVATAAGSATTAGQPRAAVPTWAVMGTFGLRLERLKKDRQSPCPARLLLDFHTRRNNLRMLDPTQTAIFPGKIRADHFSLPKTSILTAPKSVTTLCTGCTRLKIRPLTNAHFSLTLFLKRVKTNSFFDSF